MAKSAHVPWIYLQNLGQIHDILCCFWYLPKTVRHCGSLDDLDLETGMFQSVRWGNGETQIEVRLAWNLKSLWPHFTPKGPLQGSHWLTDQRIANYLTQIPKSYLDSKLLMKQAVGSNLRGRQTWWSPPYLAWMLNTFEPLMNNHHPTLNY